MLLGVVFVVMLTVDLLPGDAVTLMLGEHATRTRSPQLRDHLGLDKPFLVRYLDYVGRLARGDLGRSIQQNRPVAAELADAWPATLELTVAALLLAARGRHRGGRGLRRCGRTRSSTRSPASARCSGCRCRSSGRASVLIVIFSLWLNWLPVGGAGSLSHLVLPAVTLALPSVAMIARLTRSAVLDVLPRGLRAHRAGQRAWASVWVLGRHALRNAFIPIVTLLGLQSGQLMGGAVLTETVFAWPGLGRLMVKAIFARDYILLQGAVLVFALAFVHRQPARRSLLRPARPAHRRARADARGCMDAWTPLPPQPPGPGRARPGGSCLRAEPRRWPRGSRPTIPRARA